MLSHKVWRHAMWRHEMKLDSLAGLFLNIFDRQNMAYFFQYFTGGRACLQNISYKIL